ncbi:hypothetical protein T484DRAFT_1769345, partial [Baffinella frigidus]
MLHVRANLVMGSSVALAKAALIATRYSAFGLLRHVAASYALFFLGEEMRESYA